MVSVCVCVCLKVNQVKHVGNFFIVSLGKRSLCIIASSAVEGKSETTVASSSLALFQRRRTKFF